MEIENLRAIYLPDMEQSSGVAVYTIAKSRDGLHWESDVVGAKAAGFDLPFIDENWLIMESVQVTDSADKELFEMDIVELEGYYQKYFVIVRAGYSFVLFDGANGILNDPDGNIWDSCKYVCPVWDFHNIETKINFKKALKL